MSECKCGCTNSYNVYRCTLGLLNHYYPTYSMISLDSMSFPKFIKVEDVDKHSGSHVLTVPRVRSGSGSGSGSGKEESRVVMGVMKSNHLFIDPGQLVINHYFTKVHFIMCAQVRCITNLLHVCY